MAAASAPTSDGNGSGSTFRSACRASQPAARRRGAGRAPSAAGKPTVLLIEDNDDGREMMAMMLPSYGYPVLRPATAWKACAGQGQPARRGAGRHRPARHRRLRSGAPPARRSATRDIKLIALTGYGLAEDQRRVLEAGFDLHLVKPVDILGSSLTALTMHLGLLMQKMPQEPRCRTAPRT
jgi:CheY-like chemotaxis protein